MEFSEWITGKFLEWRGSRIGRGSSVADFAAQFGVSHQVMSTWMKKGGSKPSTAKSVEALIRVYGEAEVRKILGLPEDYAHIPSASIPPTLRRRLVAAARELERELRKRNLTGSDPEAEQLTIEIFERFGLKWTHTEYDDSGSPK